MTNDPRRGITLIDLIISISIVALLFGGIYVVYISIESSIAGAGIRTAAVAAINNELEIVRNLPYESVGTVGGIPAGVIPQTQTVTEGNYLFSLQTTVLNIDDPYDSSPSSSPVADYKLVDITATCSQCADTVPVEITTTVAPTRLAQGTPYGSIFINAMDASGLSVADATVRVVNASVTPSVDLTDTTNASGVLKLIGVPTSTQGYGIFISKPGYSSAQTYPPGAAGNPNPVQPDITVATATVSQVTLAIDHVSALDVATVDDRCNAVASQPFTVTGQRLIGTNPNVFAFSTSTQTSSSGTAVLANLAWDTYTLVFGGTGFDLAGTIPLDPVVLPPSTTQPFAFVLAPAADPSLLVTVKDAMTGAGIPQAQVGLVNGGTSFGLTTDHAVFSETDWSGGNYAAQNGLVNATVPGVIMLLANASSSYPTSTLGWLESNTFDVGGTSSTFNTLSWSPSSQPAGTLAEFQVAGNNDNATWNFIGPDGTSATYFTAAPAALPAALAGDRYFRYKVFMGTTNPSFTPSVTGVTVDFAANCVPPSQALFTNIPQATYSFSATATGYAQATGTVTVGAGEQSTTILMTPN